MKILVFLHGTTIMHKDAKSIREYETYIPVGNAVKKLQTWKKQGAEISYLSSHENVKDVEKDKSVLKKYNFPFGRIYHRKDGESYGDVVEKIKPLPDIIIEDDCESIGKEEMTWPQLKPELKKKIKSIVVKECGGIDHLPDNTSQL